MQADVAADNEAFLKRLEDALTKAVSTKKGLEAFTPLQNGEGGDAGVDFTTAKKFCSENDAERGATTVTADKWKVTIEGSATDKTVKLRTFFVLEVRDYTSSQISSGNGLFLAIYDAQGTLVDARARLGPNSFYKWHRSTPSEFQKELMACRPHYA